MKLSPATCSLLLVCLLSAGCGSASGPPLYPVTGKVTFDGKPIEDGRILFREAQGQKRGFSGAIKNGQYSLEATEGKMSVSITAAREVPGKFEESPAGPDEPKVPVREMYIPKKYNSETTLEATVGNSGSNNVNFELKSE